MPIVDGLTSTKLIRTFEKTHPGSLSKRASPNGRCPIFAVSASLVEKELQTYLEAGFDGWILKPIDFKRLSVLLDGILDRGVRSTCLYEPGKWEQGGWFANDATDVFSAATAPSPTNPVTTAPTESSMPPQPKEDVTDRERERLESLETDAVHAKSAPSRPGQSGNIDRSTLEGNRRPP